MLVLVVDDDEDYAEIISQTLRRDAHDVVVTGTGNAAMRFSASKPPQLALLDTELPDGSALDFCKRLRESQPALPVIFLSNADRPVDIAAGLNAGADDYVLKPFHPAELAARVRAVVRRSNPGQQHLSSPQRLQALGLEMDITNQSAYLDGSNLNLTRLEFDLLSQLVRYAGQVLSHGFLSEQIWGYKNVSDATLLKGHISSIRQKIRGAGGNEEMIHTVHGVGYSFTPA